MSPPTTTTTPFLSSGSASNDVVTALTIFQLAVLNALQGLQSPQLIAMGLQETTAALAYKMPIAVGSSAFQQITGGVRYRKLGELMLPVTVQPFADAVQAEVLKIQANTWTGWGEQPASMAAAAGLIGEVALAAALEGGETAPSVENYLDGDTNNTEIKIFDQDTPCDPLGGSSATKSNLFTSTGGADANFAAAPMTLANIDRVAGAIKSVKAQDGTHYRDLVWVGVVVPNPLEMKAKRYFTNQAEANRMIIEQSGSSTAEVAKPNTARELGIQVWSSPYLTEPDSWYPVCVTRTQKKAPWIELTQVPANAVPFAGSPISALTGMAGMEWIIDDLTSEGYKHGTRTISKGFVGIQALRRVGVGITCPWQLFKCKGA